MNHADLLLLGLGAVAAATLGIALLERALRDPVFGAKAIVVVSVVGTFLDDAVPPPVIAGLTVTDNDLLFAALTAAGVLAALRRRRFTVLDRVLLAIGVLIVWSTLRGAVIHGAESAVHDVRVFLYFFGGALYFVILRPDEEQRERIARVLVWAALAFCAITAFRWAAMVAGAPASGIFVRSREPGIRVIDNQNTLIVAQAFFLLATCWLQGSATRRMKQAAVAMLPFLIFLQHRTIWLVLLGGTVVLVARNPQLGRKLLAGVVSAGLAGGLLLIVLVDGAGGGQDVLHDAPTNPETVVWRIDGWRGLLTQTEQTLQTALLGREMGSGFVRELETSGAVRDVIPHNFYIQAFLRIGLIGLGLMLWLYARIGRDLRRAPPAPHRLLNPDAALTLLVTQLLFMVAWDLDMDQAIVLGILMFAAASVSRRGDPAAAPVAPPPRALAEHPV